MLDSPGILMPAYSEKRLSSNLAYTNNIKLSVIPIEEVALELFEFLKTNNVDYINNYFKTDYSMETEPLDMIEDIAAKRGMTKRGIVDYNTISFQIIKNFSDGKMGKITLEKYDE
jgi:ribosome biogenesis GTPase A